MELRVVVDEAQEMDLLLEVSKARQSMKDSKEAYLAAVLAAHEAGISNIRIAAAAKVSETAIRLVLKSSKVED